MGVGDLEDRLARVRAKARDRGVRLDPPRTEAEVRAFEAAARIRLPEGHRRFLLEIGDGPREELVYGRPLDLDPAEATSLAWPRQRGRGYRVEAVHEAERERREGPPGYGLVPLGRTLTSQHGATLRPAMPFPLTEPWVWEDEADRDEARWEAVYRDGHLFLGTDGCNMDWILVVSGPERGKVWLRADVGAQPCDPSADFLDWYERWLDRQPFWPQ